MKQVRLALGSTTNTKNLNTQPIQLMSNPKPIQLMCNPNLDMNYHVSHIQLLILLNLMLTDHIMNLLLILLQLL